MSMYLNDYIAKAKRFIVTTEDRDDLIALTIDTYDKRTTVMSEDQAKDIIKALTDALGKRNSPKPKAAGHPTEEGHDDEDFS